MKDKFISKELTDAWEFLSNKYGYLKRPNRKVFNDFDGNVCFYIQPNKIIAEIWIDYVPFIYSISYYESISINSLDERVQKCIDDAREKSKNFSVKFERIIRKMFIVKS